MKRLASRGCMAIALVLAWQGAADAACTVTYMFSNGTTADAPQVNQDFSDLTNCAAPVASPSFTGTVSLGGSAASTTAFTVNFNGSGAYGFASNDTETGGKLWGFGGGIGGAGSFGFYNRTDSAYGPIFFENGSVGIGDQTNGGWAGNAKLAVFHSGGGQGISTQIGGSTGNALLVRVENTGQNLIALNYQGVGIGSIATNDGSTTSYNTTSDARLKLVDGKQPDLAPVISNLWVGSFEKWRNFAHAGAHSHSFGVLAQQAYEVLPANIRDIAVTKPKDAGATWMASSEPFAYLALWGVKDIYKAQDAEVKRAALLEKRVSSQEGQITGLLDVTSRLQAEVRVLRREVQASAARIGVRTARN